jgi:hypothetical protein
VVVGFLPAIGAQAPAITRLQPREPVQRTGRGEIVAPAARKVQKGLRHPGADTMTTTIGRRHATIPATQETGQRLKAAHFKGFVVHVFLIAVHCFPPFHQKQNIIAYKNRSSTDEWCEMATV